MRILAVDSSAVAASAALLEDEKIIGEFFINTRLTHSQTLMPMIEEVFHCTQTQLSDVELFAVSAGPGSFTGVRIGIASIKGLAMPCSVPCVGVSTLEAMACSLSHMTGTVCAVMDARCGQVYNALFHVNGEEAQRLCTDRAISIESLAQECSSLPKPFILVGDGAQLCYNNTEIRESGAVLAPEHLRYQHAAGVAAAARNALRRGESVSAEDLLPVYLRPAQAQRNLKKLKGVE